MVTPPSTGSERGSAALTSAHLLHNERATPVNEGLTGKEGGGTERSNLIDEKEEQEEVRENGRVGERQFRHPGATRYNGNPMRRGEISFLFN